MQPQAFLAGSAPLPTDCNRSNKPEGKVRYYTCAKLCGHTAWKEVIKIQRHWKGTVLVSSAWLSRLWTLATHDNQLLGEVRLRFLQVTISAFAKRSPCFNGLNGPWPLETQPTSAICSCKFTMLTTGSKIADSKSSPNMSFWYSLE